MPNHVCRTGSFRGPGLVVVLSALLNSGALVAQTPPADSKNPAIGEPASFLEQLQTAFEDLAARVGPAVVTIRAELGPGDPKTAAASSSDAWVSEGVGVIVRPDGVILTSQHVVAGASLIRATLQDGRCLRAAVVGTDARADLAVLRVQADNLAAAELGDAAGLRRGHLVLAFGSPLGVAADGRTALNQGVVAAIGRPLPDSLGKTEDRYYGDMIQTTIRVRPGDSGGPLIDIHGRVVGLITVMGGADAARDGIGLAVPLDGRAMGIVQKLAEGRRVAYGYMGIEVGEAKGFGVQANRAASDRGVRVDSVLPNGPAARAGLREGDVILSIDGTAVRSPDQFVQLVGGLGPGRNVQIQYQRESRRDKAVVELAPRPQPSQQEAGPQRTITFRGALLGEVNQAMRAASNIPESALLVIMVNTGSPAHRAGLTPGDVIVRVDGESLRLDSPVRLVGLREDVLLGLANGSSVLVRPK
jgi:serine protease Do